MVNSSPQKNAKNTQNGDSVTILMNMMMNQKRIATSCESQNTPTFTVLGTRRLDDSKYHRY